MTDTTDTTDRPAYGTADLEAPVSRADFERAVRHLNLSDLELRDGMLQIAARLVALTDAVTRRIDGVEPLPAPPNTPAIPATGTVEAAVVAELGAALRSVRAGDAGQPTRVTIDLLGDKYAVEPAQVPCDELIPLCHGRCCQLTFALSTADLDEGVIRWDYGQPYLIRQRESDNFCVHNDPTTRGCTVHAYRPRVCRTYDCRNDPRVWIDYAQRIPAPYDKVPAQIKPGEKGATPSFDLVERAKQRAHALGVEKIAIRESFAEAGPRVGPPPPPLPPRRKP